MNRKAVSEVTGALLVIVVMLTAAGLLYLISYPTVSHGIDTLKYRNAVKNLIELREITERIRMGLEETIVTFPLGGGSIAVTKNAMSISLTDPSGTKSYQLGDLVVNISSWTLAFETGIFEKDNPIPISLPIATRTSERIYLVFYNFTGNFSAAGDKITFHVSYVSEERPGDNFASVTIYSNHCEAWSRSLRDSLGESLVVSNCPSWVSVTSPQHNISVRIYTLEVR